MNWTAHHTSSSQGLVIDEAGKTIAVAYDTKDTALLAAAPAMREALRELLLDDPYLSDPINAQRMAKARAAYQLTIEEQA